MNKNKKLEKWGRGDPPEGDARERRRAAEPDNSQVDM
jgi:hypothetical protein